jgi:hypothetical protein
LDKKTKKCSAEYLQVISVTYLEMNLKILAIFLQNQHKFIAKSARQFNRLK